MILKLFNYDRDSLFHLQLNLTVPQIDLFVWGFYLFVFG